MLNKGRKPSIDAAQGKTLREEGLVASAIARKLGIGRASVYRIGWPLGASNQECS